MKYALVLYIFISCSMTFELAAQHKNLIRDRYTVMLSYGVSTNFLTPYKSLGNNRLSKFDIGSSWQTTLNYQLNASNQVAFLYDRAIYVQNLVNTITKNYDKHRPKALYVHNTVLFLYKRGLLPKRNLWLTGGVGVFNYKADKHVITNQLEPIGQHLVVSGLAYQIPFSGSVEFGVQTMLYYFPSAKKIMSASFTPSLFIKF